MASISPLHPGNVSQNGPESQLQSRATNSSLGTGRQSHWDYYVCRFVILVIRTGVKTGSLTSGSQGVRCRQPFTPVVCQTNVTYLVYWAFYPALSPVTWAGFERPLELPILVNTLQDKGPIVLADINNNLLQSFIIDWQCNSDIRS